RWTASLSFVERAHLVDRVADLVVREVLMRRDGDDLTAVRFADREIAGAIPEVRRRLLQVQRDRVVHLRLHAALAQQREQLVAPPHSNHIKVVDVLDARAPPGDAYARDGTEGLVVALGHRDAPARDEVDLADEPIADDRLQRVEARVAPEHGDLVAPNEPVVT